MERSIFLYGMPRGMGEVGLVCVVGYAVNIYIYVYIQINISRMRNGSAGGRYRAMNIMGAEKLGE